VNEVDVNEPERVKAGQLLMILDTPELSLAVSAAEAALRSAQDQVDMLNTPFTKLRLTGHFIYVKAFVERRQQAQAERDAAQAALEVAQAELAQARLNAPYDGTVVKINVVPGQLVQPGDAALVIADLGALELDTTDLSQGEIAHVRVGQAATVHIKPLNSDFSGKVAAITPKAVESNGDWVFKVTISFDQQPVGAIWGMSAQVQIQTH